MAVIAVDAMGGDKAPGVIVKGAVTAAQDFGLSIILVGKEEILEKELSNISISSPLVSIQNATQIVEMEDAPAEAIRRKRDSSIRVAFDLAKEGKAQAVVSAGNSGATMATAMVTMGRIGGVRPAIATILPTLKGAAIMIDVGANVDCKPNHLLQFGIMGSSFAKKILEINSPKVGLLSIGEENSKGNQQVKRAFDLLSESGLNFMGNVEGRDVFKGEVDVIVCDGFVGNVSLKLSEGLAESIMLMLKKEIQSSFIARIGYLLASSAFKRFKKLVDYAEYGGAPLLGINGIGIICHGRSGPTAIRNAIKVANTLAESNFVDHLSTCMKQKGGLRRVAL